MERHEGPESKLLEEGPNGKSNQAHDAEDISDLRPIRSVFPNAVGEREQQDQAQERGQHAAAVDPPEHLLVLVRPHQVLVWTFLGGQAEVGLRDEHGGSEQVPRRGDSREDASATTQPAEILHGHTTFQGSPFSKQGRQPLKKA